MDIYTKSTFLKHEFLSMSTSTDGTFKAVIARHSLKQSGPALSLLSFGRSTITPLLCLYLLTQLYNYHYLVPSTLSLPVRSFSKRSNLNTQFQYINRILSNTVCEDNVKASFPNTIDSSFGRSSSNRCNTNTSNTK